MLTYLAKEKSSVQEYQQQLQKGIEFTYDEFENQKQAEWMQGYNLAYRYYIFHNNLDVPIDYIIDGFLLGHFIDIQRKIKSELTVNQIKMLNDIEMQWNLDLNHHARKRKEEIRYGEEQYAKWIERFLLAQKFYEENGHLNIPSDYIVVDENGKKFHLGAWLQNQKTNFKAGRIPTERMSKLDTIYMVYDNTHQAEINRILSAKDHNFLPPYLKGVDPFKENAVSVIFNKGTLSQKHRLERNVGYLRAYFEKEGNINIPQQYKIELEDGSIIRLGSILSRFRTRYHKGKLNKEIIDELESMRIIWNAKSKKQNQIPTNIEDLTVKELIELKVTINKIAKGLFVMTPENMLEFELAVEEDYPMEMADDVEFGYLELRSRKSKNT